MRYIIRPRGIRNLLGTLCAATLFLGVMPAVAAACESGPESTAFAQFGDNAAYVPAPGGSFGPVATGWTLHEGAIVSAHDGYDLMPGSTHSLAIGAGGVAVSPLVCVSSKYPSFRFVARQLSGASNATLNVGVRWVNLLGATVTSHAGSVTSGGAWAPSPVMKTDESLPLVGGLVGLLTLEVALVFQSSGGSFAIDDVFIDPYSR